MQRLERVNTCVIMFSVAFTINTILVINLNNISHRNVILSIVIGCNSKNDFQTMNK